jgi:hypothetical protein
MKWEAIKHVDKATGRTWVDQYAVRSSCGEYTVCRYAIAGQVKYSAWNLKHQIGIYPTADEAKQAADNFKQVGPG